MSLATAGIHSAISPPLSGVMEDWSPAAAMQMKWWSDGVGVCVFFQMKRVAVSLGSCDVLEREIAINLPSCL